MPHRMSHHMTLAAKGELSMRCLPRNSVPFIGFMIFSNKWDFGANYLWVSVAYAVYEVVGEPRSLMRCHILNK